MVLEVDSSKPLRGYSNPADIEPIFERGKVLLHGKMHSKLNGSPTCRRFRQIDRHFPVSLGSEAGNYRECMACITPTEQTRSLNQHMFDPKFLRSL